ncbi:MAG TPA: hypothetical protein VGN72_18875 [Tepidisphaeraceae bacterium]|jgi:hypothetical protein|nr:hypothetical protein [Tepidisphaeraceae bacterium]
MARFSWDNLSALPATLVLLIVAIAFVVWAYRPQARMSHWAARAALPLLRITAIVLLMLSVLKPNLAAPNPQVDRGAVLMVIDASQSMSIVDERTPADRVAIARAVGRLPAERADPVHVRVREQIDALTAALDALQRTRAEARLADPSGSDAESLDRLTADARAAVDEARRQLVATDVPALDEDVLRAIRAMGDGDASDATLRARADRVADAMANAAARSDGQRYRTYPTVRAAADLVGQRSRYQLAAEGAARVAAALPVDVPLFVYAATDDGAAPVTLASITSVEPAAARSDSRDAVSAAIARFGPGRVRGVVLWTDGRQVATDAEPNAATAAPVFPVNVAPAVPPRDASVEIVSAPLRPFVGETVTVQARVRTSGRFAGPIDVRLKAGNVEQTKQVSPAADGDATVDFTFKAEPAGVLDVVVALPPQPGERTDTNNTASHRMRALAGKLRIAAYAGSPTWDFQYLRNALQRAAWAQLKEAIVVAREVKLPLSPAEILAQDAIILCDIGVESLNGAQWDALNQMVSTRGGSVIILANDERVLDGYAQQPQAASLLPLRAGVRYAWRVWAGERPTLRVAPAPLARDIVSLRLADDADESARRWQELPKLFRVLPLSGLKPTAEPLLIEPDSQSPVMTQMRLGSGRVLFVGLNETWRWRRQIGERDQDRFLLQLIRHAAGEPYAARGGGAAIDVDAVTLSPGGSATVRARVQPQDDADAPTESMVLKVSRDGEALPDVVMAATDAGDDRFEARLTNLASGRYDLSIDRPDSPHVPLFVEVDANREMLNVASDPEFLKQLADSTGGAYATVESFEDLPQRLLAAGDARYGLARWSLWDSPQLFLFVLACLGTEWALRKRLGLA